MDYHWLEVIRKSLASLDMLASKLKSVSGGEALSDFELRMVVGEIEENTSRVSRLLSFKRNREIFSRYHISTQDLGVLIPHIDDNIRRHLLRGNREVLNSVADKLTASTQLWRDRIIHPTEMEMQVLKPTDRETLQNHSEISPDCKVILLLGAGASTPLQVPTMAEFWPILLANSHSEEEKLALDMLLETAKYETVYLPPDLEKLLGMVDKYETYFEILWEDPFFGFPSHMLQYISPFQPLIPWSREKPQDQFLRKCGHASRGISWIKDKLTRIMDASYTKQFNQSELISLYQPLFSFLNNNLRINSIVIFTTNYDTVIEQYCKYSSLKLIDGFQKSGPNLIWNPLEYYHQQNPNEKAISLFKLHGSLTWRKIGNEIFEFGMSAESMPGGRALIYPTETKEYPYEEPFKTAYKSLDRFLKTANVAIVVGYSFRDRSIAYIIDEALSVNPTLRFVIVCGENLREDNRKRFPYGSVPIELNFQPGENAEYLARLNGIISEVLKEN